MDSQGRSRLIIGGLTLAVVVLVISLLMTQQGTMLPIVQESPLTPDQQMDSPLAAPHPDSPLAAPGAARSSSLSSDPLAEEIAAKNETLSVTERVTGSDRITANSELTETAAPTTPVTVTARSTVTVTLVASQPLHYGYEVMATYPHDPNAYTQGLQYIDGVLFEGTGLRGNSSLRRVNMETGEVEQLVELADQHFGEGVVVVEDRIYQLTWQSKVAFVYDRESFELLDEFNYPTEGWGLTYDGQDLIMSDGSSTLYRRDPETFAEVGRIEVRDGTEPVNLLNELEYINGAIWANVWYSDTIVIIDPTSGQVIGRIDLAGLLPERAESKAEVLNGIAYDEENDRVFVTGKFWPTLFEIELIPR